MTDLTPLYKQVSATYGLSIEAIEVLAQALVEGGYRSASFNHRELGGVGKWNGGDVILGDMSQEAWRLKIWRAIQALLPTLQQTIRAAPVADTDDATFVMMWWADVTLREPAISGVFESLTYGYFLEAGRVVVRNEDHHTLMHYDARGLLVTGLDVAAGERGQRVLVLRSINGDVPVHELPPIESS